MGKRDQIGKLLAYALDGGASEGELENAGLKALRIAKQEKMTVAEIAEALGATITKVKYVDRVVYAVPPDTLKLNFGKYKGKPLSEVYKSDPGYLRWMVQNCKSMNADLKRAADDLLNRR